MCQPAARSRDIGRPARARSSERLTTDHAAGPGSGIMVRESRPGEEAVVGEVASWLWDETTWRGHVEQIRAGRRLLPEWPDGARVAVALSFDSDHETIPLRDGETGPGKLSQGEFGARVGVRRILALLAARGIPATFFMLHARGVRVAAPR